MYICLWSQLVYGELLDEKHKSGDVGHVVALKGYSNIMSTSQMHSNKIDNISARNYIKYCQHIV